MSWCSLQRSQAAAALRPQAAFSARTRCEHARCVSIASRPMGRELVDKGAGEGRQREEGKALCAGPHRIGGVHVLPLQSKHARHGRAADVYVQQAHLRRRTPRPLAPSALPAAFPKRRLAPPQNCALLVAPGTCGRCSSVCGHLPFSLRQVRYATASSLCNVKPYIGCSGN